MPECPRCRRPVALARSTCLYCGAALGGAAPPVEPSRPGDVEREARLPPSPRALLILDTRAADAARLQSALAESAYEAGQRARRGGFQLLRIAPLAEASVQAARLQEAGVSVMVVAEEEVRGARPLVAQGGRREGAQLHLYGEDATVVVGAEDVLLVVQGPIVRQYQTILEVRRKEIRTATLEPGYRVHLHRRAAPRPIELDPGSFAFAEPPLTGSSLLELSAWVDGLRGVIRDEAFRWLPPALAPAAPATGATAIAEVPAAARTASRGGQGALILDNLEQFRFHSGWRGAVQRRLSAPAGPVLPSARPA